MKLMVVFTVLSLFLAVQSVSPAYYGARPMGMGGAFTAVANDANAAYWNPAGFALNPGVDITGSTLTTNRNAVMGDNLAAAKFCYEAPMSSPFEWILGIGFISSVAMDIAQTLGDTGVLKKNWGRDVEKTSREEPMAEQVKEKGDEKTESINPFKRAEPKPRASRRPHIFDRLNFNFNFYPHRRSYWYNRMDNAADQPFNKAQFALGLTWLNDNNPAQDELRNWYTVSLASGWEERIAVGGNINFYDLKVISNQVRGFGAGVDVGAIAKPLPNMSLGAVAKEIFTTDINWQNGAVTRYEMLVNGGLAIDPFDEVTIAVDAHNIFNQNRGNATMHYGLELRPVPGIALRGGLSDKSKTAGASVALGGMVVDYAYLGGDFAGTQMIGAAWKF